MDRYPQSYFEDKNFAHLGLNRFRPNIVFRGAKIAHFEDEIRSFEIANKDGRFDFALPCARCPIPQIDQTNGIRGHEPKSTLWTYRRGDILTKNVSKDYSIKSYWKDRVFFGSLFMIDKTQTINVGDKIVPLSLRQRV